MKKIVYLLPLICFGLPLGADAYEYNFGRGSVKLTGYGTAGMFEPIDKDIEFMGDWRLRGQLDFKTSARGTLGLVYTHDEISRSRHKFARDAFLFYEEKNIGRFEVGFTSPLSSKLGLGLPDVGGLRINDYAIFYDKISPDGPIISNPAASSQRYAWRASVATAPGGPWQFGLSITPYSKHYRYAADMGAKWRNSGGKIKTSLALGASFIDKPENFIMDMYGALVTADFRTQFSAGLNIQYNSFVIGLTGRAVYDINPIGESGDGIQGGIGASYDLLKYSISASYVVSDTGVWQSDVKDYVTQTGILSFRYKYTSSLDLWLSGGISTDTPFISAGLRYKI